GLVELHAAGHAGKILRRRQAVADRLRVPGAAVDHVGDQDDLVVGVRVEVRGVGVVFRLERLDEVAHELALVGRVELHDADVAVRAFGSKPNGSQIVPGWLAWPPPPLVTPACASAWVILRPWPSSV